jgi:hypothetical protein
MPKSQKGSITIKKSLRLWNQNIKPTLRRQMFGISNIQPIDNITKNMGNS